MSEAPTVPLPPGSTLGMVGGGQLGRMFTFEARRLGYRVHTLDPTADGPTAQVADRQWVASFDDQAAASEFADSVDVVGYEFENIPAETLEVLSASKPVHPSPRVLRTCRDRIAEKAFLTQAGIPVAPYREARSAAEVAEAAGALGGPCILKTATLGYDGKGQVRLAGPEDAEGAWEALKHDATVVEGLIEFDKEISVVIARDQRGQTAIYPPFENQHRDHILDVTSCPASVDAAIAENATALASRIAEALDLVGVLCVEMFVCPGGQLLVNELAPRPHNSGHLTLDAALTSQFEQQVRAICGLPLGKTTLLQPAAMVNLLGDLWSEGPPPFERVLALGDVRVHLYGKAVPKPGRKMGHLVALADNVGDAQARVLHARDLLRTAPS